MKTLECETCPISMHPDAEKLADRICPVVAGKVLSGLGKVGIDTCSDMSGRKEILEKVMGYPAVIELAKVACNDRLLILQNTSLGYSEVAY